MMNYETEYKRKHAFNCAAEQIEQLKITPAFIKTGFRIELIRPVITVNGSDQNDGSDGDIFYYLNVDGVTVATGNIFDVLAAVQILLKLYGLVYLNEPSEPRHTDI